MAAPTIANSIGVWDATKLDYVIDPNARVTQFTEMDGRNRHWRNTSTYAVDHVVDRIVFNGRDNIQSSPTALVPATSDWTWVFRVAPTTGGGLYCQGVISSHPGAIGVSASVSGNVSLHLRESPGFASVVVPAPPLAANRQATLIVIRSGHRFAIRVNGAEVAYHEDDPGGPLRPIAQVSGSPTAIGKNMAESGSPRFSGQLTRLGLWPFAFSGSDLSAVDYWARTGEFPQSSSRRQLLSSPHLIGSL